MYSVYAGNIELYERGFDSSGVYQFMVRCKNEDGLNARAINVYNDRIVVTFGDVDFGPHEFVEAVAAAVEDVGELGIDYSESELQALLDVAKKFY